MKNSYKLVICSLLTAWAFAMVSCSDGKRIKQAQDISINEIMASNRTGLLTDSGKTADWIELKNNGQDSLSLKGFKIAVIKDQTDSLSLANTATKAEKTVAKADKSANNDSLDEAEAELMAEEEEKPAKKEKKPKEWTFPDVTIGAGDCLLVFAQKEKKDKKDKSQKKNNDWKPGQPLVANLNLPKQGGTIQFLGPNGKVIKEVKYGKLAPDQSYSLVSDSTYVATYRQTPGFDNSPAGYESASQKIADQRNSPIVIWELMSRAQHEYENWVELKNVSNQDVSLAGYRLSRKLGNEEGWPLPDRTLKPGEIITIQLAGSHANASNPLQAPFKIGNAETIVLSKDGRFVDGACAKGTPYGASIGRADGRKGFFYYATPTRNADNGTAGKRNVAEKPAFDLKPGVYPKAEKLTLRLKDNKQVVHYTINGSEPTAESPVLKDTLVISKGTVVRTFAEGDSTTLRSPVATDTYLPGADHKMAVLNIAVNNSDLYDHNNGIYANGPGYDQEWPHTGANYFKRWTKKAHVEFFDDREGKDGFETDCGLMIFGGFSRAEAKKSFRLKFRGQYGNQEIDYDFFGNGQPLELEDLVLRSGSQDWNRCMVRDEFFTSLLKAESPELLTQMYRPVALYVNGEYFGLYYLREKIDKNFVQRKLNLPTNDSINIIMSIGYNEEGSSIPYKQLIQYAQSHDMSVPENYKYMKDNVDLQGLIDYKLGEIFSGNSDVGNIRYVRSTAPGSDKKWHFVFYDLDASWAGNKTAEYYLSTGGSAATGNATHHNIMINSLLKNNEFRDLFLQRLSHHIKNTFSTKNASAVFDNLVAQIRPEMKRNCERWPQLSYEQWEKNVTAFREKFKDKPKTMLDDLRNYLHVTDAENKKYFAGM